MTVPPRANVLLVEDDPGLSRTLTDRLRAEGYDVVAVRDGVRAIAAALEGRADAIVLDVMLPGKDGIEVLKEVRAHGIRTPVIMLTARDQVEDKVVALKLGADDYVTKPFRALELLARLEAVLRRARGAPLAPHEQVVTFGVWSIDLEREVLSGPGGPVELSRTEFELLRYLLQRRGHPVAREELLREVWRYAPSAVSRTVDQHVAQLRRKLERGAQGTGRHILTVHGRGYLFRS
ncbi:MAG: response regulator transcription factor [Gemmatimonadales bacterium]|nr:response regulator transcription factor [Gemmatimonadales bacterium]